MEVICDRKYCSACKACVNACPRQCISMEVDSLDCPYPVINQERCVDCGQCQKSCPNCNELDFHKTRKVLAAWSLDTETRKRSASGGVAAELYKYAIENGWHAFGVFINREKASFIAVNSLEDIENVRNSKYVYSDTNNIYSQIKIKLNRGQKVLFVGLPCQVAGLYSFLGGGNTKLTTVDLVCHGVVPDEYLKQHIDRIERSAKKKTTKIYFRNPDLHTYTYTFTLEDSNQLFYRKQVYEDDVYQLGYHKALIYRENCFNCRFAQQKRLGDLTICDFPMVGEVIPVSYNRMNVSCVLVNTERGEQFIDCLKERLFLEQRPWEEAFEYEPQLNHPYERHPGRELFMKEYTTNHDFQRAASIALKKELDGYKVSHPNFLLRTKRIIVAKFDSFLHVFHRYFARRWHRPYVPFGSVLMLHRIDNLDGNGIWYNQHLRMSPTIVKEMVGYARKHKCRFVSLDEMEEAIRKKKNVRRWIAITLDDGYRDNYLNGVFLFRKLNVPYTIYVCTKMVKGEMLYWWEILEQLILRHDEIVLNDGRTFDCSTKEAKEQAFLDIREIILKLSQDNLLERLKELFGNYEVNYNYGNDSLGLTWKQIRELMNDSLATIGNHTYSHSAFTGCTDDEICADIKHATDDMLANTGITMQHFAFPFGEATAVSQHDVDLIKQLGFKTSATTKDGLVCYGTDPLELPRIFVTERNWKQVIDRIIANC